MGEIGKATFRSSKDAAETRSSRQVASTSTADGRSVIASMPFEAVGSILLLGGSSGTFLQFRYRVLDFLSRRLNERGDLLARRSAGGGRARRDGRGSWIRWKGRGDGRKIVFPSETIENSINHNETASSSDTRGA